MAAEASETAPWFDGQGVDVTDGELMEYISESSMMSKALVEYEGALRSSELGMRAHVGC